MRIPTALTDLLAALVLFLLTGMAVAWFSAFLPVDLQLPAMVVLQGALLVGVVGLMLLWRGRSWRYIGFVAPVFRDALRGALTFGGCLGINLLFIYGLYGIAPDMVETHTEELGLIARHFSSGLSLSALLAVLAFVGLYEEIYARGLLLTQCRFLLRGTWPPVVASSVLFGLGHLYQGWIGVVQTTLIGLVLARATIRWGTLWPAIIAHAMLDTFSILLMEHFASQAG